MEHVVIGGKLHEACVLIMGKGSGWESDKQQEGFSTVTPRKTAATHKYISSCKYDTINNKV